MESLLRYGIIVSGGLYNNALQPLNIAQNYILKVIFKKEKIYSTNLLYSAEIPNVRSLYILSISVFVHKNVNLKNYVNHSYQTRSNINKHLIIPNSTTNINLRFISYLAPKIYNVLP